MFSFFRKAEAPKKTEATKTLSKSEPKKSAFSDAAQQDLVNLKTNLVHTFAKIVPPLITDEMKTKAIANCIRSIGEQVAEAIESKKDSIMLLGCYANKCPPAIRNVGRSSYLSSFPVNQYLLDNKNTDMLFAEIAEDLSLILTEKGIKHTLFKKSHITIKVEDLKEFSNFEKLNAIR